MSKNGFWESFSNTQFFAIVFVLFMCLIGVSVIATINGTLWEVGSAFVTSLLVPIILSLRFFWPRHKTWAIVVAFSIFILLNIFIAYYYLSQWTVDSKYFLALIEYFGVLVLVTIIVGALYGRYFRTPLKSK